MREFLATKQITVLEHPAYSMDLAPNDFFLFLKTKEISKGRHFDDIDDIKSNTMAALKTIPQNQFQNCFEGWTRRWHRCIASQREYCEGTTVVFSNEVCSTFTVTSSRTLLSDHIFWRHLPNLKFLISELIIYHNKTMYTVSHPNLNKEKFSTTYSNKTNLCSRVTLSSVHQFININIRSYRHLMKLHF